LLRRLVAQTCHQRAINHLCGTATIFSRLTLAAYVLVSPLFYAKLALEGSPMPSLFRFLTLIGVLGGLTYGAMFMLATWFDPKPREITVSIPPDRFAKQP
jgi:hypothetical protein